MILFFSNNRSTEKYFGLLCRRLLFKGVSVCVFKDNFFRLPALRYLFKIPFSSISAKVVFELKKENSLKSVKYFIFFLKSCWLFLCDIKTIEYKSPTAVVVWNGLMLRRSIFVMAAKNLNIKVIFVENGLLPETTVVDGKGINYMNSVPRSAVFYKEYKEKKETLLPVKLVKRDAKEKKMKSGKSLPLRYIFVPFQVDTDSQILLFSPWIDSMEGLFSLIKTVAYNIPDIKFIFKEHPSSPVDYSYLHSEIDCEVGFFANEYSTQELIENSIAVITINSTVGIESLLLNKKVICLGEAFYNIEGITLKAESESELKHIISNIDNIDLDREATLNFLRYLKGEYLVKGSWRSPSLEHLDSMVDIIDQIKN